MPGRWQPDLEPGPGAGHGEYAEACAEDDESPYEEVASDIADLAIVVFATALEEMRSLQCSRGFFELAADVSSLASETKSMADAAWRATRSLRAADFLMLPPP
mmetsp:Transcript_13216/g.38090  ORF Transcript_13216/g.38090 Transcript_13216/m.38090 type:complete len:103 (+) Transcript_13216:45-353(+)